MSLAYGLLGILTYSPMTGYHLGKIFDKSINVAWTASLSQVYRELNRLEKQKYVTYEIVKQEEKPDRKIYTITNEGKKTFETWLFEMPEDVMSPKRDEFMLRIFFGSTLGPEKVIEHLKIYIKEKQAYIDGIHGKKVLIEKMRKVVKTMAIETPVQKVYWQLIIQNGVMMCQSQIEWATSAIETLEKMEVI